MSRENRYRLLLLAYPRSYRTRWGNEMLDALLDTENRRPSLQEEIFEVVSVLAHGLAQRFRFTHRGVAGGRSRGLAGASLLCLLAVLGASQLAANGTRAFRIGSYPDVSHMHNLWVDPRWPVHVLWLTSGLALLIARHRLLVASAWTAAAAQVWYLVVGITAVDAPWVGNVGPHWTARPGYGEAGWALLSTIAALLLGGPRNAGRACNGLPRSRWRIAAATGAGAIGVAALTDMVAYTYLGNDAIAAVSTVRGPAFPVLSAAAVLTFGFVRTSQNLAVLAILAAMATVPLALRWSEWAATWSPSMAVLLAGTALFVAGYTAARLSGRADLSFTNVE
jgi:hypothetical protein